MDFLDDMRTALDLLEAEMRGVGWWQQVSPAPEALASVEPFCVDCLTFSEWLQWVYIPKMHAYMNQHGRLPAASGLVPIAEEAWKGSAEDTRRLHEIVALLDALVAGDRDALPVFLKGMVRH
ncbi:MAG: YqcC family protein [Cardiobacteriaceae bacterium]|nr:YqcC family protein [Cardiobacteriaceae bacterium]